MIGNEKERGRVEVRTENGKRDAKLEERERRVEKRREEVDRE